MKPTFESRKKRRFPKALRIPAVLVLLIVALAFLRVGGEPEIEISPALAGLGPRTPVVVHVTERGRGLSGVRVELVQGELRALLAEESFEPRPFWAFWGERTPETTIDLDVGRDTVAELRPGEATLRVSAGRAPTWLRRPDPVVSELTLPVRLKPPYLVVTSTSNTVAQGGSAVVTYRAGESSVRDGVELGELFFPGYALPGGAPDERFALFAAPHDLEDPAFRLVAIDDLGNRAETRFLDGYQARPLGTDTIELSEAFLERVVPAVLAETPSLDSSGDGDLLADYLKINGDLRRTNAATLAELASASRPAFQWSKSFRQQPGSRVMASFAERRTYLYEGREVDLQDHLGFDLASVRRAPIAASNDGVVVLAEYFGIYGNTVVLDHGCGLLSLYAHLSSIGVEVGQEVVRGETLGRSGQTGLAGGDHLHFSMLVQGVQVLPLEWWDRRWIRSRIAAKLGSGFVFEAD